MTKFEKNGLLYWYERFGDQGEWYFKPVGALIGIVIPSTDYRKVIREDAEKFVAAPGEALEHYNKMVADLAEVDTAQAKLDRAKHDLEKAEFAASLSSCTLKNTDSYLGRAREAVEKAEAGLKCSLRIYRRLVVGGSR